MRRPMRLKTLVLVGVTVLFVLVVGVVSLLSAWNLERNLTREFITKGGAIAKSLANSSIEPLLMDRASTLQAMVDVFLEIPGVGYVWVVDGNNIVVSHTFVPGVPEELRGGAVAAASASGEGVEDVDIPGMGEYIDVSAPILAGIAGAVHVGMDRSIIRAEVRDAVVLQALFMLAIFGVGLALTYAHVAYVTRPLGVLTAHAHEVASSERLKQVDVMSEEDVETALKVDAGLQEVAEQSTLELRDLAAAFLRMEEALRQYIANLRNAHRELAEHNRTLEDRVAARTSELRSKNDELEAAMVRLKDAQEKIVTQEKLASLGALTAGVAHEIKNPLNFINNFAELSGELTTELSEVSAALPADQSAQIVDIAEMLRLNVQKIAEHGKRADSIVRNMLLHSRTKQGERTSIDLNALLQEYVGLAYHGVRAQDQAFNAKLDTRLDPAVGAIDGVQQDLGRAFLNLLTNACHAIRDRQKEAGAGYAPTLTVVTRALDDDRVEIRIRDNGTGIPPAVKAKMFEPFFTTKAAGSGTGLGLSMTFDIIVQTHKGSIDVDTEPGEFAEFILTLPRTQA